MKIRLHLLIVKMQGRWEELLANEYMYAALSYFKLQTVISRALTHSNWTPLKMLYLFLYSDHDEFFRCTKQVLDELGIENYTSDDCKIVKYVCTLVSARAAFLSSAGEYNQNSLS
jgi:hypothetical protein